MTIRMKTTMVLVGLLVGLIGCGEDRYVVLPTTPTVPAVNPTSTPTPTLGPGANISFFGILRQFDTISDPIGVDSEGRPIFDRPVGNGFVIVVEAKPGSNGASVGTSAYDEGGRPDLQVIVSRDLGDGSPAVCDNQEPNFGGVPGVDPPSFADTPMITDALNDLGCRFVDGTGAPVGRPPTEACVLFQDGEQRFVDPASTVQFCARVTKPMSFPVGDTVVSARVRDDSGMVGPELQIVIRVGSGS